MEGEGGLTLGWACVCAARSVRSRALTRSEGSLCKQLNSRSVIKGKGKESQEGDNTDQPYLQALLWLLLIA